MMLDFYDSDYGKDFEACWDWPEGWPHEDELEYLEDNIWFKAYDTSLCETKNDIALFEQGYLFDCIVRACYYTPNLYCEDVLARFPARTREEAERLLQLAADALYEEEA